MIPHLTFSDVVSAFEDEALFRVFILDFKALEALKSGIVPKYLNNNCSFGRNQQGEVIITNCYPGESWPKYVPGFLIPNFPSDIVCDSLSGRRLGGWPFRTSELK